MAKDKESKVAEVKVEEEAVHDLSFQPKEEQKIQQNIANFEENKVDDDEFVIDPLTGDKRFKLDKDGCRKGWIWDKESGRCIPISQKDKIERQRRRRFV